MTTAAHNTALNLSANAGSAAASGPAPLAPERLVQGAAMLLVAVAPFELQLVSLPGGLALSSVEAAILLLLAPAAVLLWRAPWRLAPLPPAVLLPGAAFFLILFVAALTAGEFRGNALRFAGRMTAAAAIFVTVFHAVDSRRRARQLVAVLFCVATVVGLVAALEAAEFAPILEGLRIFRPGFHVVAGQLRATSTLFYPTIASMYLEIAFALGLWLLLDQPSAIRRALVVGALAAIGAGIIATFTRAGLIGMVAALALAAAMHALRVRRIDRTHARLAVVAALLVAMALLSRSPELLMTRFRTEGSQAWYGATYEVPPSLRFTAGEERTVTATLTNTGRIAWDSARDPIFAMSYHWLRAGSDAVVQFEGARTPFPVAVEPGARITLPVIVNAPPQPGNYVLVWDVVHETRAWLSTEGVAPARSAVLVEGRAVAAPRPAAGRLPETPLRPDRWTLWRAALEIARTHPWLGVGPDNYRLVYGRFAGFERWDTRVHANNMYLEVLAGTGLAGLAALMWLVAASGLLLWRRWQSAPAAAHFACMAGCAVWLMVAGHAVVDSFLSFTTTYVVFAVAAGIALSPGLLKEAEENGGAEAPPLRLNWPAHDDAHRV